jgi:hypothetical protein
MNGENDFDAVWARLMARFAAQEARMDRILALLAGILERLDG